MIKEIRVFDVAEQFRVQKVDLSFLIKQFQKNDNKINEGVKMEIENGINWQETWVKLKYWFAHLITTKEVVLFLSGAVFVAYIALILYNWYIGHSIQTGSFIHKKIVYSIILK